MIQRAHYRAGQRPKSSSHVKRKLIHLPPRVYLFVFLPKGIVIFRGIYIPYMPTYGYN